MTDTQEILRQLWEEHVRHEFATHNTEDTLATMDHSNLPDPVSDRLLALDQELIELRKKLENQDSPRLF